jgi:hypothetical protein
MPSCNIFKLKLMQEAFIMNKTLNVWRGTGHLIYNLLFTNQSVIPWPGPGGLVCVMPCSPHLDWQEHLLLAKAAKCKMFPSVSTTLEKPTASLCCPVQLIFEAWNDRYCSLVFLLFFGSWSLSALTDPVLVRICIVLTTGGHGFSSLILLGARKGDLDLSNFCFYFVGFDLRSTQNPNTQFKKATWPKLFVTF